MGPATDLTVGGPPPAHTGQAIAGTTDYSTNWAGYAVNSSKAGAFTSVTATWVQPELTCNPSQTSYAAFWGGLDGSDDNTVEQTGTLGECVGDVASYSAWYELYPQEDIVTIADKTVSPGDRMTATVTADGSGKFTLVLSDTPKNGPFWSETVIQKATTRPLPLQESAEAIVEAPSSDKQILPLANFGTMSFTGVTANNEPIGSAANLPNLDQIDIESSGGQLEAITSNLTNQDEFSVSYQEPAAPSPPPSPRGHHHR